MAAEAALVAEELGKIVSAQQIFVLRKAIYRLTAHSTNPHAVLYAHLPLRSASGALRQSPRHSQRHGRNQVAICKRCAETKKRSEAVEQAAQVAICKRCAETKHDVQPLPGVVPVAICTRCTETKTVPFVFTSISLVAIRTNCAETKKQAVKYVSIEKLISDAREAYYEAQNSTIFPPSRKDPDDHDRIHLHSHESLLPAIWEARLCHGCKAAARGAEPQHGGPLCVPGVRHLRGGFRPLGQEAPLHSGQAEPPICVLPKKE